MKKESGTFVLFNSVKKSTREIMKIVRNTFCMRCQHQPRINIFAASSSFKRIIYAEREKKLKCFVRQESPSVLYEVVEEGWEDKSLFHFKVSCLLISRLIKWNQQQQVERLKDIDNCLAVCTEQIDEKNIAKHCATFPIVFAGLYDIISIAPPWKRHNYEFHEYSNEHK